MALSGRAFTLSKAYCCQIISKSTVLFQQIFKVEDQFIKARFYQQLWFLQQMYSAGGSLGGYFQEISSYLFHLA